jgi:hypothetical protein
MSYSLADLPVAMSMFPVIVFIPRFFSAERSDRNHARHTSQCAKARRRPPGVTRRLALDLGSEEFLG